MISKSDNLLSQHETLGWTVEHGIGLFGMRLSEDQIFRTARKGRKKEETRLFLSKLCLAHHSPFLSFESDAHPPTIRLRDWNDSSDWH